jgi:transposase-like protein
MLATGQAGGCQMPRKSWSSSEKLRAIMDGIKGKTVPEICGEYGIVQSMYYRWRDQFLRNAESIFTDSQSKKEKRLERENDQLRQIVADQALELKKTF